MIYSTVVHEEFPYQWALDKIKLTLSFPFYKLFGPSSSLDSIIGAVSATEYQNRWGKVWGMKKYNIKNGWKKEKRDPS